MAEHKLFQPTRTRTIPSSSWTWTTWQPQWRTPTQGAPARELTEVQKGTRLESLFSNVKVQETSVAQFPKRTGQTPADK